ncbi:Similar to Kinesin light chain 3; acc. no. Q68G30 [Pyronema omphalodes CBS 100304]|uniref:Similar to Kinesin light chain 3 acc. no. Q68G30 n=1 Tax=Pyronema omphalodes (strain CBS 100304) TaxID=1076935 RepID=U4L795_PYROM|nr:Similar to Kinesin light chain 3; acc. no. Q68G30 [Pyronema omphalodes CBS 100304]
MNNLAVTYKKQGGRLKEAQELREKFLEVSRHTLGEEHPDTLRSMSNLAVTYGEQGGKLKEVQELEEKVLEVRRSTLGEEHPDTLRCMSSLAVTLHDLERPEGAISLMEEAACLSARVYGGHHSYTKTAEVLVKRWKDVQREFNGEAE